MSTTKVATVLWSSQVLTALAGDTPSAVVDLTDGYGAVVSVRLTNGATGPTYPAEVQVRTSEDNVGWYNHGGILVGGTANNEVAEWGGLQIPAETQYLQLVAGSNTGQDVVVDAILSELTEVS